MASVFVPSHHSARRNTNVEKWSDVISGAVQLREGDSGNAVTVLHQYLASNKVFTWPEGAQVSDARVTTFGASTTSAVKAFQHSKRLAVDGVVGKYTANALQNTPLPSAPAPRASVSPPPVAAPPPGAGLPAVTTPEALPEESLTDKPWFWPVVAGVSLAVIGGVAAMMIAKSGPKSPAPVGA